ncbi:L-aspartate oxidase [Acidiphilium sp. AL]|uniref:L-aspartate oxidase n=1 Tax=Acidiphilium iwatense TaxID=768198 RepID=A0ABS9DVA0_9PROT|nr:MULTISPECIES: L-aspartate oxidase [Acidiphilium]MCF3946671.1 L-aspartate oxidase [Acidiphilium iwatense]MCU4159996.1 L-aspartate oxidase [Acidiphilium sp. AL]
MTTKYIIGAGVAGLAAALAMTPEPVMLITAGTLDEGAASLWSQGGIAAATGDDDSVALHAADTIAAGDGLCDPEAVSRIVGAGPRVIERLRGLGVAFNAGLGLEAAHSRRRIVHVQDRTGLAITTALARAVQSAPHITILERTRAIRLHTVERRIAGLWIERNGNLRFLPSDSVLIATGGVGALYHHTSNPDGATGSGLALAARAGAILRDLEFVQFHPTGLDTGLTPMPLISEAVRGEGAMLIDETGARFTKELAPRDTVSRAVFRHLAEGHRVFLDATHLGARFAVRFPAIDAACRASGIDPAAQPIPIRPVAHYHMGGIAVDAAAQTSVDGLFAAGEAACTGLHGANRLASNSLLEAFVTGESAGLAMARLDHRTPCKPPEPPMRDVITAIRGLVSRHLGVLRDGTGLATLISATAPRAETSDAALIALMMAVAAFDRRESRGGHARTDFPCRAATARPSTLTMAQALARAAAITSIRHAA